MKLTNNQCSVCGGHLLINKSGFLECESCNTCFKEQENILSRLDNEKIERISNARKNLYNVTHTEYLNKKDIKKAIFEVLKLYPDDFLANFYDLFLNGNAKNIIPNYLNIFDFDKGKDYLNIVIEFTIKNLETPYIIPLKSLVDHECNKDDKLKYFTLIENESEKLDKRIYDLNIDRDVFVCYSSVDIKKVSEIVNFLENQGLTCFVALNNLRHGIGSAENYEQSIYKAMKNSKCFLFLSSTHSRSKDCDAIKYELPYLKDNLVDKKRIEYIIEEYNSDEKDIDIAFVKSVFKGLEWCTNYKDLIDRLVSAVYKSETISTNNNVKYCVSCLTENPIKTKHCIECDGVDFVSTFNEALKIKNEKEIDAYKRKSDEEYKAKQKELKDQQEKNKQTQEESMPKNEISFPDFSDIWDDIFYKGKTYDISKAKLNKLHRNDIIEYGEYPQSLVTDDIIIATLDEITITDVQGYKSYNGEKYYRYYVSSYTDNNGNKLKSGYHYYKVEPIKWRYLGKKRWKSISSI